jgi:lipopolysaccharide transport system ATP-binding protein
MTHTAISVENLSKAYHIGLKQERHDTFVGAFHGLLRAPLKNLRHLSRLNTFKHCDDSEDIFWALRDVSFEVQEGEVVGIIGRNGAGKSTLLKILSRITEPTRGRAIIRGRVSSLLEVGTGFHQELTGRENVYMNGTILGMTKREIDRKFDEIVDFSGVEKFLDTPIKHYSSGMKVRLAFSVAAHLEPEILIIDEVLAVGDAEFQRKCLGKMQDVARGGRTVLFVSHNMVAVRSLCNTAVLLGNGMIVSIGEVSQIVDAYICENISRPNSEWQAPEEDCSDAIHVASLSVELNGQQPAHSLKVEFSAKSTRRHEKVFIAIDFFDRTGGWLMQSIPTMTPFLGYSKTYTQVQVFVDLPPLIPGDYSVGLWMGSSLGTTIRAIREAVSFSVSDSPTPERTAPHNVSRGYFVPVSRIERVVTSNQLPVEVSNSVCTSD